MEIVHIGDSASVYPPDLKTYLGSSAPETVAALGNLDLLKQKTLALFCSVKCPGNLILETYDLAGRLRHAGVTVIGGFHSPMERECLVQLLRGSQPIIACPARSLAGMRLPGEYQEPLKEGRLLVLSPFSEKQSRATAQMALYRNRFVAALAGRVFVAYAEPAGKTEQFCREIIGWGKPLYTLGSDANANLMALGASTVRPEDASRLTGDGIGGAKGG